MSEDADLVERLAQLLHESGREAVEKRQVYRDDLPVKPFCEWEDLHENAREGRRSMAQWLLGQADLDAVVRLWNARHPPQNVGMLR